MNEVETTTDVEVQDLPDSLVQTAGDDATQVEEVAEGTEAGDEPTDAEAGDELTDAEAGDESTDADVDAEEPESEEEQDPSISDEEAKSAVEALLFAADEPLTKRDFRKLVPGGNKTIIDRALAQLLLEYEGGRGIHLAEVNNGFQFRTNPELSSYIIALYEAKPTRISRAAMETLAIVAYQQPIVKSRIDEVRGVDCTGALKKCIELDMVVVVGQADDIGRPNLYATTERFLQHFGLKTITDLPTLDTFEIDALELVGEDLRDFMPEDEREEILAEHVAAAENELSLDERISQAEFVDEPTIADADVYPSSAANDDGTRSEEE